NIDMPDDSVSRAVSIGNQRIMLREENGTGSDKFIKMGVSGGFEDDKFKVLSANPDETRNLTDEEATVMRNRLKVKSSDETSAETDEKLKNKVDKGSGFLVK